MEGSAFLPAPAMHPDAPGMVPALPSQLTLDSKQPPQLHPTSHHPSPALGPAPGPVPTHTHSVQESLSFTSAGKASSPFKAPFSGTCSLPPPRVVSARFELRKPSRWCLMLALKHSWAISPKSMNPDMPFISRLGSNSSRFFLLLQFNSSQDLTCDAQNKQMLLI